jgi:hypothetical protein
VKIISVIATSKYKREEPIVYLKLWVNQVYCKRLRPLWMANTSWVSLKKFNYLNKMVRKRLLED